MLSISKALALPPTFVEEARQAFDALRGLPSELKQSPFQQLHGPPSPFQELSKLGADLYEAPDALRQARAPAPLPAPATTKTGRGAPRIHNWDIIERLDAAYCRTYFAKNNRAPTWKEREDALRKRLGNKPHWKTLQRHLPKIALLKERNSRSI
jgi:hypothetical protein